MSDSLYSTAREYVEWESDGAYKSQVQQWIDAKDEAALKAHFVPRIAFGTAGLRSRMAPGYKNMNPLVIRQTTQGLIKYMDEQFAGSDYKQRGIVVGYDGRHHSSEYAKIVARLFLHSGYKVYLFSKLAATPFVPYAILQYKTVGGIMITASHNPKDDNGYKLYWENGAQIIMPRDSEIKASIDKNLQPWDVPATELKYGETANLIDPYEEMVSRYMADSARLYCWNREENQKATTKVVYTAMHGVGAPFTASCLEAFGLPPYIPTPEQVVPDPDFSTVKFPNPEEGKGALALAIDAANAHQANLILANDPDADRLAVAERTADGFRPLNGNEIAVLLADYVWRNHVKTHPNMSSEDKKKCYMLSSTVSSKILVSMAETEGFSFKDTLTGFKWMGNVASDLVKAGNTFLFAYEVEIGFLIGNMSYDKDGIRTAAVFNEMYLTLVKEGKTCFQRLEELYQKYGYFNMNPSYFFVDPISKLDVIFARLRNWKGDGSISYPEEIGNEKISSVRDVTRGYDSSAADGVSALPKDTSSHMITFRFANGCMATLRNSGTEPKLKYYIECRASTPEAAAEATQRMSKLIIDNFIEPEKHQLVAQATH